MAKASKSRNFVTLVSITALPLALCTGFAEARGVGVGLKSPTEDARSVGRATNPPMASPDMASQADRVIVAERAHVQVPSSETASLLEDLRLQLAAQPAARLNIRWQLTRPLEAK